MANFNFILLGGYFALFLSVSRLNVKTGASITDDD